MQGYIALSRVRAAHHMLLSQPFNPALFRQKAPPFPTLLMNVLRGEVPMTEIPTKCLEARQQQRHITPIWKQTFLCSQCLTEQKPQLLMRTNNYLKYVIEPGKLRSCVNCTPDSDCIDDDRGDIRDPPWTTPSDTRGIKRIRSGSSDSADISATPLD